MVLFLLIVEGFFWVVLFVRFDFFESSLKEVGFKVDFMNGRIFVNLVIFDII